MATSSSSSSSSSETSRETVISVSPVQLPPTPPPTSTAILKSPTESKSSSSNTPQWTCSEDTLPAAAFYGPLDAKNPLLASCEKETRELLGFMKKKKALALSEEQKHEFHRRCATTLFNIWTKYAPRLPSDYYNEKLLKVGDSLCQMKEYKLALLQCYGRYLQQFTTDFDEYKEDVNQFKSVFFPKGFGDETAGLTFHALSGKNICSYELVCDSDANLQNKESVSQCLHILSSLRLIMQVALPQEHLCWILFNGTIYIYTICRKLMLIGQASKALEYLLWASVCMESSVPLLSVRYLTWRATLYTAVCQCHYDCQTGIHGEAFARRALAKIDELRQLELMSSSQCQEESRKYYREATIKMAVMIFKRGVYESRRKGKAVFRPKIRINLKEAQSMVWPRTVTERLLDELFDSTSSRFLAVLEALSDSSRRILQTGPLVTDEVELRDVVLELFMAGKELLILSNVSTHGKLDFPKTCLLEHVVERKNVISALAAVKFAKLAFSYEEWALFESLAGQLIYFLQKQDSVELKKAEKDLILLLAAEPLINLKKNKGSIFPLENDKQAQPIQVYLKHIACHESCVRSCGYSEDIFHLAAILHYCVCTPSKGIQPDKDIVVDTITFLWQKCKLGIQRINVSRSDFAKYSHKISTNKWVYLLWQISEVIHCYQLEDLDIVMVSEITLRITEILESLGSPKRKFRKSAELSAKKGPEEFPGTPKGIPEVLPILKRAPSEQLFYAYELLDKAIAGMNWNSMLSTLSDGSSTIDHCYVKYSHDIEGDTYKPIAPNSFMMDLHLELIQAQHRIAVVLLDQLQVLQTHTVSTNTKGWEKLKEPRRPACFSESTVRNKIKKNKLSRACYLMQKALLLFEKDAECATSWKLLMEAYTLIEKIEAEQNALYSYQKYLESSKTKKSKLPPPPILLARTHCSVTLKPAPFISDVKVSWYCILGCKAGGSYSKVRLNNNHLPNSGEAIPADGRSTFEIKGLETNEKYIFAIAAYSANGKLIGDAVGETTKPILIYPPLSAVTARMYLTQVAYQVGNYELAKKVFSPVWDYIVASPLQDDQSIISLSNIMTVTQRRLHSNVLADTSSILLYLFLRNIFVMSDIKIKEENLFCDNIKGNEIFPAQQLARLMECENVLVALELSNFLNDANYALQAVTQCYGLLAPIIYHNIVLVPVIQILIKCIVVLQGIPSIVHSKKNIASFESIQHMIACCIFYMTKILRSWKEYDLAVMIINYGKKTLDITSGCKSLFGMDQDESGEEGTCSKKTSRTKKPQQVLLPEKINEQLALLETHLLKLTKQYTSTELSGAEDPIFLYPVVLNWSVKGAMKEVMKFKQRPRFLEFFTQVMLKCMNDEKFQLTVELTAPVYEFLKRRNESLIGVKRLKCKDSVLCKKTPKSPKKYKAIVIEIGKSGDVSRRRKKKKETLKEFFSKNPSIHDLSEQDRNKRSDVRKMAYRSLTDNLNPIILNYVKRKRFHQILLEELPWRSQMNLYLASAHFHLFFQKLAERTKMRFTSSRSNVSFRICDPNLFSLFHSGTVLPTAKLTVDSYKAMLDVLIASKRKKPNQATDTDDLSAFWNSKSEDNISKIKTQTIYDSESQSGISINDKEKDRALNWGLDHFMNIFLCCRRAMVLAHRGGYWTLLQNCCRVFWNFSRELQILLKQIMDTYKTFPITQDGFLCTCVLPFNLGTELLIDMLIKLQSTKSIKPVEEKGDFSVPSCYGNIKYDNGGSSLTFEHPLDDVNVVDLKWIRDFVLKSLELLYQVEKWETLVSLAIQFNIISHERYTEQVTPLLVYAQRQLLVRIQKFGGPDVSQQACARYEVDNGEKITCRNFIGKQLTINPSSPKMLVEAEGSPDLLKTLILSEHNQAKQLVCVPVDVTDTLRCFRESLEKSKYHNRSVRHSRKLLSLLIAQTQGDKGGANNPQFSSGKVDFCLGTEEMHMPIPPDLSQENFRVFSSVEKSKLPYSQLGLVISSHYQTIDVLQASNQRSLKVQVLHALGNLFIFAEKKRAAFKCWCQALDDIFRKPDALHTWKEFGTPLRSATNSCSPPDFKDYSEEFLSKLGIWGCVQGAVIAAKIAQFIKTANVKKRINACILSALLFQSLLRTTLPHPKAERSYAQYEITQLLPGIELFTDKYRADISSVIATLYYIIRELHYAKYNLTVLPLLALYQYFVTIICQDIVRNLEVRILKIEILIDLGFFSEAFYELSQIFYGKNMPCAIPAGYKATVKIKITQSFDSGKPLLNKDNIQALEDLMNRGLPLILVTLGHQHLLNKFNFVKAYFFLSLAATINCIPDNSPRTLYHVVVEKSKPNLPNLKDFFPKDNESSHCQLSRFRDEYTLSMIKSLLLMEAEDRLNCLVSEMEHQCHKPLCQCSVGELETMVEARLQLAAIALQRHRAAYGAAIVYSTLKLLQDSKIFKKRMPEDSDSPTSPGTSTIESKDDNEFLDPVSLNAREYFNIHLWLRCRLMLVTAFVTQIHGVGVMKENDMTDCLSLINEVCMEAKSADDPELLAEFLMQAVILGLQEKHLKADIIKNLQEIIHLLEGNEFLSPRSWLTLARSLVLMDDLTKAEKFKQASSKEGTLTFLKQAHNILIAQMLTFGETIEFPLSGADYANPLQPLKNIYLPHVMLLAKIKLRIGHTLSKQVCSSTKKKDITKWLPPLHIFEMALKLCQVTAAEEYEVEAEILFQKGRIERQILIEEKSPVSQIESFFEAIQISLRNDQNSGLIRDSYLEIALVYFHLKRPRKKVSATPSSLKPLPKRHSFIKEPIANRFEIYSSLAWIAIRAAAQVSEAVLAINLLIGKKNARTDKVNHMALLNIPEFATVDLFSSYADYLLENYQVAFQTGSSLYLNEDVYDSADAKRKGYNKVDITWILLIRYYIHLQRINNMSKLLASATPVSGISLPDDMLLTSLFNSELILRQKEMHLFLKRFFQLYSSSCIEGFPRELLQGVENFVPLEKVLFDSSGKVHRDSSVQSDISGKLLGSPSYTESSSEMAAQALNKELCFQWYMPPLDKPPKDAEPMVLLLYAYNLKPLKISDIKVPTGNSVCVGTSWFPLNRVIAIHEKLSNLAQIAELSLPSVPEIASEENIYESVDSEDKSADTDMENMILECCSEIMALFSTDRDPTPLTEVPFDVSLPAIFNLERLFDLANGCIVSVGSLFNWVVSIIP
ncbi:cilia- and flagella-associated protein 54 isoform X1 [Peromyscus californicus insignis]|uniref:cilia- and flagella-associated protein 54 isoform X1 n=2 Tax=Peromyscus californicus insignis TaxID=564181 RepID=UPI0022A78AC6|nr:cilia- and flagella-associated protein 54 isoform X1 [Peromyscus californicus insignis]